MPQSPFAGGAAGALVAFAPVASGRFAFVNNILDAGITGLNLDTATGALSPMAGSPFSVGITAYDIATISVTE